MASEREAQHALGHAGRLVLTLHFDGQLIDDLEQRFPWVPGNYYKTNPVFEGLNLPIWWS